MSIPLRIGTRGSLLARSQTEWVARQLQSLGHEVEITVITTRGDTSQAGGDVPIPQLGTDGVFVRELQRAMLDGRIDFAVHSLKDLPTAAVDGLCLACVPEREIPFDALVGRTARSLAELPPGAIVGTSSIRRVVQVRRLRPDVVVREIRGNVDSRLRRLDAGEYDAILLAAAGLSRLGLSERVTELLRPDDFWPAVGQGALALEARSGDDRVLEGIRPLDHAASRLAVVAERACLERLAGGCLAPIGAWGTCDGRSITLGACVLGEADGGVTRIVEHGTVAVSGATDAVAEGVSIGRNVAERLERLGASAILARTKKGSSGNL